MRNAGEEVRHRVAFLANYVNSSLNGACDVLGLSDLVTPAQTPSMLQSGNGGSVSELLWTR